MSEARLNVPTLQEALPRALVEQITDAEIAPLKARADEIIEDCAEFLKRYPTIDSDDVDNIAAELLGAEVAPFITERTGRVDRVRIALKAPILIAAEVIDGRRGQIGPFAALAGRVESVAAPIRRASTNYKVAKKARAHEEARIAREKAEAEARLAERLATNGGGLVTLDDAAAAQAKADEAARVEAAKPADLTRSHGSDVGTTSLRYKRTVVIVEPDKVPRQYCTPDLSLIARAAGKAGTPFPKIDGVNIVDEPDLTVRR